MRISVLIATMLLSLGGGAWATTTVLLSSNLDPTQQPRYVDQPGPHEFAAGVPGDSSTLARGAADYGVLKAYAGVVSIDDLNFSASSFASFTDTLTLDAGALNGQSGYAQIRVNYDWSQSASLSNVRSTADNQASLFVTLDGQGFTAQEYWAYGYASPFTPDAFVPTSSGVVLVSAVLGDHVEALVPVTFGEASSIYAGLSIGSAVNGGTSFVNAYNSAYWGGLKAFDANMQEISVLALGSSGFNYAQPIPEPATYALFLVGLAALIHLRRGRSTCS